MARQTLAPVVDPGAQPGLEHHVEVGHPEEPDVHSQFFIRMAVTFWPHILALLLLGFLVLS